MRVLPPPAVNSVSDPPPPPSCIPTPNRNAPAITETPIGANARDLEHFVNLFGYSPAEAMIAATKWGGELMEMNLGQIKEGYLADLLLVNDDPTQDVSILQDRDNLIAIMKDGSFHKAPDADVLAARRQIAAPAAAE